MLLNLEQAVEVIIGKGRFLFIRFYNFRNTHKRAIEIGSNQSIVVGKPVSHCVQDSCNRRSIHIGWQLADVDLIEANEAFAAQALSVGKMLEWDERRVNVNGGAIAMGHPLGATGAMILGTLLDELERQGKKRGLATLCVGGGMGIATIIELV